MTYRVVVEGIGDVHHGHDRTRARAIYLEYCTYSRQESGNLSGLDVTLIEDGVETETYFAPRPEVTAKFKAVAAMVAKRKGKVQ